MNAASQVLQRMAERDPANWAQIRVAERAEVSPQVVSCWFAGTKKPAAEMRVKLRQLYQLDPSWWDQLPIGAPPPQPAPLQLPDVHPPRAVAQQVEYVAPSLDAPGSALDQVKQQCARLHRQLHDARHPEPPAVPADVATTLRLEAAYTKALKELAVLSKELGPADETKLVQTATFQALLDRVSSALKQWPDARAAVIKALSGDTH